MADGRVTVPYSVFLGYDKGEDGNLVVNEKEAHIVRLIYRKFMEGMAPIGICHMLDEMGILTPGGKIVKRKESMVKRMKAPAFDHWPHFCYKMLFSTSVHKHCPNGTKRRTPIDWALSAKK